MKVLCYSLENRKHFYNIKVERKKKRLRLEKYKLMKGPKRLNYTNSPYGITF